MTGYVLTHEGKAFAPEGRVAMTAEEAKAHNDRLEAKALEQWNGQPKRVYAYIALADDGSMRATTWQGAELGKVVWSRKFRHNMAGWMRCYTVRGNNGATYYGRHSDGPMAGNLIMLRKHKARGGQG